jgi:hypothetical protein
LSSLTKSGGVVRAAVIAPLSGELFSETNDNSAAILLARALLGGDAEAGRSSAGKRFLHEVLNGGQRSETTHRLSYASVPG